MAARRKSGRRRFFYAPCEIWVLPSRLLRAFAHIITLNYWEIIADNLSKAGWSWGCVSAIDSNGRTIWIADAHRDDGRRFIVHADEKPRSR
jgi:hypothetical protein